MRLLVTLLQEGVRFRVEEGTRVERVELKGLLWVGLDERRGEEQ